MRRYKPVKNNLQSPISYRAATLILLGVILLICFFGWHIKQRDDAELLKIRSSSPRFYATPDTTSTSDSTSYSPDRSGSSGSKDVYVRGYYRRDGTYVHPYTRSAPGRGRH